MISLVKTFIVRWGRGGGGGGGDGRRGCGVYRNICNFIIWIKFVFMLFKIGAQKGIVW